MGTASTRRKFRFLIESDIESRYVEYTVNTLTPCSVTVTVYVVGPFILNVSVFHYNTCTHDSGLS